ncbi:MAG: cytochrome c3 family protein [candidate division NC10 bacterium]|nr:cytochrome c3 family protein [candidate division NC10 bacterium]MDE2320633.1 cytochrome c3 family protein [candidate division NC10 bacterium]
MKNLRLILVTGILVVASAGVYVPGSGAVSQPIQFSHKAHVKEIRCLACHPYYEQQASAGLPRLADCLVCHVGTQSKKPEDLTEEKKLAERAEKKEEIRWVRLYRLPDHAFFSHRRHVVLGKLECETCHGDIAAMDVPPEKPAQPIKMGWCVSCHRMKNASTDCNACHH